MAILLVGLNHHSAPVALRERLFFSRAVVGPFLAHLRMAPGLEEAVVLSTCNRTEVYAAGDGIGAVLEALAAHAGLTLDTLLPHVYLHEDRAAVRHLFRVACGLDSLVIGETQILGQVREALAEADAHGAAGRVLQGLLQQAIAVGKRARAETGISTGAFSVGRAAVEQVRRLFPDLRQSPILLLGAGKMSELTARHLAAGGVQTLLVANRTHDHALALAHALGGTAIHYDELFTALTEVDILISSTSAPHFVLLAEEVARAMARRGGRPLCLIDIAVPRDIEPAAGDLPGVHLYNIDDLEAATAEDRTRRAAEIPAVEAIIDDAVGEWGRRQAGLEAAPVIAALHDAFEQVRLAELERQAALLDTLTPAQQEGVHALTRALVHKLLHTPTVRLKDALAARPDALPLSAVRELFALDLPEETP
jgi:glutamyl-tRNA reductase